jgi:hypothetical protein
MYEGRPLMRGTEDPASYIDWQQRRGAGPDIICKMVEDWADTYATVTGHVIPVLWRDDLRIDIVDELRGAGLIPRDSDGTATAAVCEDIPVPQDCQARPSPKPSR